MNLKNWTITTYNLWMDQSRCFAALMRLGEHLRNADASAGPIDILVVGACAGILTGELPRGRTTIDCDVMVIAPVGAEADLLSASERVAQELGMPARWFNTDVQLLRHALPAAWEGRRVHVLHAGALHVHAIGRLDLLAMKVYAGRAQDLDDVRAMRPRPEELRFVAAYLDALAVAGEPAPHIADARTVLDALEGSHGR